jgi:predicted transcriptional regulator
MAAEESGTREEVTGADLVRTLGSKYSAEILGATSEPRSAQELSNLLDVPIATCYRRIEELTEAGLLELEDSVLSDDHRRVDVYRRGVDELTVVFGDDDFEVEVEERTHVKNKIDDAWRTLTESR